MTISLHIDDDALIEGTNKYLAAHGLEPLSDDDILSIYYNIAQRDLADANVEFVMAFIKAALKKIM